MAIAIEAAELMEKFQWAGQEEAQKMLESDREEIENELVDVLAYILSFANQCNVDLSTALTRKMELNGKKYPVELSKGKWTKYSMLK